MRKPIPLLPYLFAFAVSIVLYWWLPAQEYPYKTKIIRNVVREKTRVLYADLELDGITEKLILTTSKTNPYVEICDVYDRHIDQWNLFGKWSYHTPLVAADYDGNGHTELYAFVESNDSVFLCAREMMKPDGLHIPAFFLFPLPIHNGNSDYSISEGGMTDVNGDGYGDVVFAFTAGYNLQPRGIYAFDVRNQRILSSPHMGAYMQKTLFADLDHDGFDEIWVHTLATANYAPDSAVPCNDNAGWLIVLGKDLETEFPPVPFYGRTNKTEMSVLDPDQGFMLLTVRTNSIESPDSNVCVFDAQGDIRFSAKMEGWGKHIYPLVLKDGQRRRAYVYSLPENEVYQLSGDALVRRKDVLRFESQIVPLDLPGQHFGLCLTFEEDGNIAILDAGLQLAGSIVLRPVAEPQFFWASAVHSKAGENLVAIHVGYHEYLVSIAANPVYPFRFLKIVPIFLAVLLLVWISNRIQYENLRRKQRTKSEIQQWQLKYALAQVDPHFTFNALNAIGSVMKSDDPDRAYDYMLKFTKLIRSSLQHAEEIAWSLEEEVRFVDHFLTLQQLRFKDMFEYKIHVDATVDQQIQVPKMLIQHYADNAVKHGLRPKGKGGILSIAVRAADRGLLVEITDNGIGRDAARAQRIEGSTGKGEKITAMLLRLYRDIFDTRAEATVTDRYSAAGQPAGTQVMIYLRQSRR
jgi:anti-sigma regulatory factor (Ser/Thr protein kinase)